MCGAAASHMQFPIPGVTDTDGARLRSTRPNGSVRHDSLGRPAWTANAQRLYLRLPGSPLAHRPPHRVGLTCQLVSSRYERATCPSGCRTADHRSRGTAEPSPSVINCSAALADRSVRSGCLTADHPGRGHPTDRRRRRGTDMSAAAALMSCGQCSTTAHRARRGTWRRGARTGSGTMSTPRARSGGCPTSAPSGRGATTCADFLDRLGAAIDFCLDARRSSRNPVRTAARPCSWPTSIATVSRTHHPERHGSCWMPGPARRFTSGVTASTSRTVPRRWRACGSSTPRTVAVPPDDGRSCGEPE